MCHQNWITKRANDADAIECKNLELIARVHELEKELVVAESKIRPVARTRNLSTAQKKRIYARDGCCVMCKVDPGSLYQIDHKIPWSQTHDNSDDNLQTLCPNCHAQKTQDEAK